MPPTLATTECANPLFLAWVKEWWDQAKERNTKGVIAYRNAYESLRACPIRFEHPDQLVVLKGFGPKTCSRLLDRLRQHCEANGLPVPKKKRLPAADRDRIAATAPGTSSLRDRAADPSADPSMLNARPTRRKKAYVPALRQGGYGIVMGLSAPENEGGREWMTKAEIIELAQPHCDASFTVRPPGKFYTAWESIKTLMSNDLVAERGRPAKRYALTEEGWEVANRFRQVLNKDSGVAHAPADASAALNVDGTALADLIPDGTAVTEETLPDIDPIVLPPGSFTVQLLLDNRERVTGQRTYMEDELAKKDAKPIVRPLALGDAMWVAKVHDKSLLERMSGDAPGTDEVVLDWIVERKRQDDLLSSIKDGRFREQKFRLGKCGLGHVVYVIEESGLDADVLHRYEDALQTSVAATQVTNGYFVQKTRTVDETIAYLARLTKRLAKRYESRPLRVVPTSALTMKNHLPLLNKVAAMTGGSTERVCISYPAFASMSSKTDSLTLRDVFLKMLMCTRGVTGEKALEIQKIWGTPAEFFAAYEKVDLEVAADDDIGLSDIRKRKRGMVSDVLGNIPGLKRRVTKPVSEKLAETWAEA